MTPSSRLTTGVTYAVLLLAAGYLLGYLVLAVLRLRYPFELEWMEGATVDHVARVLAGKPLYLRPSLEFVPFIYTPFYLYLSAGVAWWLGIGFFPLRLVSVLASLGALAFIYHFVQRETGRWSAGLLAASLFAATYAHTDGWFDIARVDSLFLCLLLAALYTLRFSHTAWAGVLGGALIALAFLSKQIALPIALPILLYVLLTRRRQGVLAAATAMALIGGSTGVLNAMSHGWYLFYIVSLPGQHHLAQDKLLSFWTIDLLCCLPLALPAAVWYFARGAVGETRHWYALMALGMIGGAWSMRLHPGGHVNSMLPAYALLALLGGLAYARASARHPRVALLICLAQFLLLLYNPLRFLPTAADLAAGRQLQQTIAMLPGEVALPCHGYLSVLAGKHSYAHAMAVYDVDRAANQPVIAALNAQIISALTHRRFSAIILDSRQDGSPAKLDEMYWFQRDLYANYYPARVLFPTPAGYWPVSGLKVRPQVLFLPKR